MRNLRIIVGIGFLACLAILGQPLASLAVPDRMAPDVELPESVDWNATYVEFPKAVFGNPWNDTLKWFAMKANLPLHAIAPIPDTSFTFSPPRNKKYTLSESYDILNEILQTQHKYRLVRGVTALTLVDADDELPDHLIPRLPLADLKDRGRTEIVEVVIRLRPGLDAEEAAPDIKRALGVFGHVTPVHGDRVIVRGTVAALLRVLPEFAD
jgi:hypothetical protein